MKHYTAKNGYTPRRGELASKEAEDLIERNGVIEFRALYEGGPALGIVLTDKGQRMAERRR